MACRHHETGPCYSCETLARASKQLDERQCQDALVKWGEDQVSGDPRTEIAFFLALSYYLSRKTESTLLSEAVQFAVNAALGAQQYLDLQPEDFSKLCNLPRK